MCPNLDDLPDKVHVVVEVVLLLGVEHCKRISLDFYQALEIGDPNCLHYSI